MNIVLQFLHRPIVWVLILVFVLSYPMLISMYVFLPLLIGIMGYVLIQGIEEKKFYYILISVLYFINLEVNLSLPFFLTIISVLITYSMFYHNLVHFRKCQICKPIISVILIDFVYLSIFMSYNFIFQIPSVKIDYLFLYTLIVDMLVVVIL